jgi:enamine deaminase RidA (YjgF/YER057c/UK114 family)
VTQPRGRQRISSGGPWEERGGYSRAVRVGDRVWVAGTTGTRPDGEVAEGAAAQTELALDVIGRALEEAGARFDEAVMGRIYLVDFADLDDVMPLVKARLGGARPAMTAVQVAALVDPRHRVEIEVEAVIGSG